MINRKNFDRLVGFMGSGKIVAGGQSDADELYIAPTVLVDVPVDSPIMQDEVFGPILPVLEINSIQAVIDWVNERRDRLACTYSPTTRTRRADPRSHQLR